MAQYRCKASGNIVEFTLSQDIESMIGHDGYEKLDDNGEVIQQEEIVDRTIPMISPIGVAPVKQRGRPKKNV